MYDVSEKASVHDSEKPTYGSNGVEHQTSSEVDILEKTIGGFGKWQLKITLLMSLLKVPLAWTQLNIVFIAPRPEFWCKPPEQFDKLPVEKWKTMIHVDDQQLENFSYSSSCYMKNVFNNASNISIFPCPWGYEYNTSEVASSIITDWGLVCDKAILVDVTQMITMLGILLGMVIFGTAADKFGRRSVLLVAIFLHILCGLLSTASPWYSIFLLFKFLSAWASSGLVSISFVTCLEVVAGTYRTATSILTNIPWGIAYSLLAVLAYFIRDWRLLQLTEFLFCFIFFSYFWVLPESPRWLLIVNRREEAIEILEKAAKENGRNVDVVRQIVKEYKEDIKTDSVSVLHIFKHNKLRKRALLLSLKWFINGIIHFGLYQLSGTASENVYLSVIIVGLISIPGHLSAVVIVKKFGRKISMGVAHLLTAASLFIMIFVPQEASYHIWAENFLLGVAIFGLTIVNPTMLLLSGECYPTVLRISTLSMNIMCSKLGGMLAPFIVSLEHTERSLPFLVFGTMSLFEIFPLFCLPETLNIKLPETIEDVENS